MGIWYWIRRLYSLDTLDTRLTVPSTAPAKLVAKASSPTHAEKGDVAAKSGRQRGDGEPAKWKTPEFFLYYAVFLYCIPMMFKSVIDVSQPSHPGYYRYHLFLSDGWILGRKVDNSDVQYAGFRNNIPALGLFLILHPLLRKLVERFLQSSDDESASIRGRASTDIRLRRRVSFDYYFGFAFLLLLNGISAFKILGILYTNYKIATKLRRKYVPITTWLFNLSLLFANELCQGYRLGNVARFVTAHVLGEENSSLAYYGDWIEWKFGGLMPKWEVLFKITILRMISFNMDHYWSFNYSSSSPIEKKQTNPELLSERERVSIPAPSGAYNFRHYLAYILYSPLYITGPILTFNDYISQSSYKPPSVTRTRTALYAVRFLITLLFMELMIHYIYVVAISQARPDWSIYSPFQLSMLGYFNLHHIWLKLLLPWRLFRLWALLDGIDPPENMVRCMSDNYSALAFWRAWHRSFNRWVVRYLYIPLGGGAQKNSNNKDQETNARSSSIIRRVRAIFNFSLVFTFVAIWHDINLRLLTWSWLITLFVLPEIIATMLFPASKWQPTRPTAYRMLCGIGAVANILMMMVANLVGFALGLDGLKGLIHGIIGSWSGIAYVIAACGALFVGAQVMFEIREGELRAGIRLKC